MGSGFIDHGGHCGKNVLDLSNTLHGTQFLLAAIIFDQWRCLALIDTQTITNGFFVVVCPLPQDTTAFITTIIQFGW